MNLNFHRPNEKGTIKAKWMIMRIVKQNKTNDFNAFLSLDLFFNMENDFLKQKKCEIWD